MFIVFVCRHTNLQGRYGQYQTAAVFRRDEREVIGKRVDPQQSDAAWYGPGESNRRKCNDKTRVVGVRKKAVYDKTDNKYSLIVFVAYLKRFFDDDQRIGKLAAVLAVEHGGGDFRSQISRLERPVLRACTHKNVVK